MPSITSSTMSCLLALFLTSTIFVGTNVEAAPGKKSPICSVNPAGGTFSNSTQIMMSCSSKAKKIFFKWNEEPEDPLVTSATTTYNPNYNGSQDSRLRIFGEYRGEAFLQDYVFKPIINGACGANHGTEMTVPPLATCLSGSPSYNEPWNWSCNGKNGGSTAKCNVIKVPKAHSVNLIALKLYATPSKGADSSELINRISKALAENPESDLIITPEYSLFTKGTFKHYLEIKCDGTSCITVPMDAAAKKINEVITNIRSLAANYKTNIILGTVAEIERKTLSNKLLDDIVYNTQLVIDGKGQIIAKKRKITEWSSTAPQCLKPTSSENSCRELALQLALDTVNLIRLKTRKGEQFTVLPTISTEKDNEYMLSRAAGFNSDIVAHSENEGNCSYETITRGTQENSLMPACWKWAIEPIYLNKYVKNKVTISTGHLIVSEAANGTAGIISFDRTKLLSSKITNTYIYGTVAIDNGSN
ncbi:MAG: nitrilase-related carbon-nitrogen hydrolase [Bdellovibrionota bacterium]